MGWMEEMNGWMQKWRDGSVNRNGRVDVEMGGWMDGQMEGWIGEKRDGWMDGTANKK